MPTVKTIRSNLVKHRKIGPYSLPQYLISGSLALFFVSFCALLFTELPGVWVGSYISTALIALPAFAALWRYAGPRRAVVSLAALGLFGFAIETTGTVTGFPYGAFFYGDSLGPKLAGHVPYILPVSYVPLVIGAIAAFAPVRRPVSAARTVLWILASALLLTLLDGVMDPGATALGFWVWPDGGAYYGVPLTNYVGWILSSLLACGLLITLWRWWGPPPGELLDSVLLALAFWCGIAVFEALWFPALLGAGMYVALLVRRLRLSGLEKSQSQSKRVVR